MFKFSKLSSKSNGSRTCGIISIVYKDGIITNDYFSVKFLIIRGGTPLSYRTRHILPLQVRSRNGSTITIKGLAFEACNFRRLTRYYNYNKKLMDWSR